MGRTSPDKEVRRLAEWKRDQDPKRKAQNRRRHNKWAAKNRAKKKAERQGVGTLEGFWKV